MKRTNASGGAAPRKKVFLTEVKGPEDEPVPRVKWKGERLIPDEKRDLKERVRKRMRAREIEKKRGEVRGRTEVVECGRGPGIRVGYARGYLCIYVEHRERLQEKERQR